MSGGKMYLLAFFILVFGVFYVHTSHARRIFQIEQKYRGTETEKQEEASSKKSEGAVEIIIKPRSRSSLFFNRKVKYKAIIKNGTRELQEGTVQIDVTTDKRKFVAHGSYNVSVPPKGARVIKTKLPLTVPGIYKYDVTANLTSYDDTLHSVFAYNPLDINPPFHKPDDFDAFWDSTKAELAAIDPKYEVTLDASKSTIAHKVYKVTMYSLNNIKIYGWLTIPKVGGHYPVLIGLPGYKNVLGPLYYDDFASFQLNIRDKKPPDDPPTEAELDFTVFGLSDRYKYIYRGVYMDCIRAIDFLSSHRKLGIDTSRLVVGGGSQGGALCIVVSAMDKRVTAAIVDNPVYSDFHNLLEISGARSANQWPVKKYNEYMQKMNLYDNRQILKVLDYFDVQNFAPQVTCPVVLGLGLLDHLAPPACVFSMYNKLTAATKKKSELFTFARLGHEVSSRHLKFHNLWMHEIVAMRHP